MHGARLPRLTSIGSSWHACPKIPSSSSFYGASIFSGEYIFYARGVAMCLMGERNAVGCGEDMTESPCLDRVPSGGGCIRTSSRHRGPASAFARSLWTRPAPCPSSQHSRATSTPTDIMDKLAPLSWTNIIISNIGSVVILHTCHRDHVL